MRTNTEWFPNARYGMLIHYGLYSLLERGEWVMNKEEIPVAEYANLANRFNARECDFDALINKAKNDWGMKYATFCGLECTVKKVVNLATRRIQIQPDRRETGCLQPSGRVQFGYAGGFEIRDAETAPYL